MTAYDIWNLLQPKLYRPTSSYLITQTNLYDTIKNKLTFRKIDIS